MLNIKNEKEAWSSFSQSFARLWRCFVMVIAMGNTEPPESWSSSSLTPAPSFSPAATGGRTERSRAQGGSKDLRSYTPAWAEVGIEPFPSGTEGQENSNVPCPLKILCSKIQVIIWPQATELGLPVSLERGLLTWRLSVECYPRNIQSRLITPWRHFISHPMLPHCPAEAVLLLQPRDSCTHWGLVRSWAGLCRLCPSVRCVSTWHLRKTRLREPGQSPEVAWTWCINQTTD